MCFKNLYNLSYLKLTRKDFFVSGGQKSPEFPHYHYWQLFFTSHYRSGQQGFQPSSSIDLCWYGKNQERNPSNQTFQENICLSQPYLVFFHFYFTMVEKQSSYNNLRKISSTGTFCSISVVLLWTKAGQWRKKSNYLTYQSQYSLHIIEKS